MKKNFLKTVMAAGVLAALFACSDSSSPSIPSIPEYATFTVTGDCYWLQGDVNYLIYENNTVTDENGNKVGVYDPATGVISGLDGEVIVEGVDLSTLTQLNPAMIEEANNAAAGNENGGEIKSSASNGNGSTRPDSASSSASGPGKPLNVGKADPSGYPVASYEKLGAGAKSGWGSRYWDACKPHCSQRDNVDTTANPFRIARNCSIDGEEVPAFTLSPNVNQWWTGYEGTKSACEAGGDVFACTDMAPVKVNDTLSYAFVATSLKNAQCGQCFQLQFDGGGHSGTKAAHKLIKGKTLVVLASNTGSDVEEGQFDIMIPGGGVGIFDALSTQLGVSKASLGANDGGLLTSCQMEKNDYDLPASAYKDCVKKKCLDLFSSRENLLNGCLWFADWFETADNPTYYYKKVECPQYLLDKYYSTINTSKDTNIKPGSY